MPTRAAILLLLAATPTLAGELPPGLAGAVRAFDRAQSRNDTDALGALVSDDFLLVNSNATVEDKRQYLADFHLPGFRIAPYVWQQPVRKAWDDGAVTGGLLHLRWTQDGARHERALRIAYVWRKRRGHWQAVYAQVTRMP